jgi:hypothetical protein
MQVIVDLVIYVIILALRLGSKERNVIRHYSDNNRLSDTLLYDCAVTITTHSRYTIRGVNECQKYALLAIDDIHLLNDLRNWLETFTYKNISNTTCLITRHELEFVFRSLMIIKGPDRKHPLILV